MSLWIPGLAGVALLVLLVYRSESLRVLLDIAAAGADSRLKQRSILPAHQAIEYGVNGQLIAADLYRPAETIRAAIVLVPGAAEAGKDDPRLVAFAQTLARTGFLVLVPQIEQIQQFRLRPDNSLDIVEAFQVLQRQLPVQTTVSTGLGAFSYAAGPAILAALNETIRSDVDFVLAIGGYYDIRQVMAFISTGRYQRDDRMVALTPHPFTRLLFILSHMDLLAPRDKALIHSYIERYRHRPEELDLEQVSAELGVEGRSLLALMQNTDLSRVEDLYMSLPQRVRENLDGLDMAQQDLSRLHARLLLIHGRDDNLIPYTQSLQLAKHVPAADVYVVGGLQHVNVRPSLFAIMNLWRAVRRLLALRSHH